MMASRRMRLLLVASVLGIGAAAAGFSLYSSGSHAAKSPVATVDVPSSQQAAARIEFTAPTTSELQDSTLVSADAAEAAGLKAAAPDLKPLNVVLAHVTDESVSPATSCLCWVISVDPAGMVFDGGYAAPGTPRPEYHAGFSVIVVDARAGEPLYWRTGGDPPGAATPRASATMP